MAEANNKRKRKDSHRQTGESKRVKENDTEMLRAGLRATKSALDIGAKSFASKAPSSSSVRSNRSHPSSKAINTPLKRSHRPQDHNRRVTGPYGRPNRNQRFSEPLVIHNEEWILNNFSVPQAADYGLTNEVVDDPSSLIVAANLGAVTQSHQESPRLTNFFYKVSHKMELGDECMLLMSTGHGRDRAEAERNAHLHALCQLHDKGLMKEILPGGKFFMASGSASKSDDAAAKKQVIDFAARHDCFPIFEAHLGRSKLRKRLATAVVTIPDLGLTGLGRQNTAEAAMLQACLSLKLAAEARHEREGDGTLLVKDYTKLTSASSRQFLEFFAAHNKVHYNMVTEAVKEKSMQSQWLTKITLPGSQIPPTGEESTTTDRTFSGIPMKAKKDAEDVGYLAAGLALKKEDAVLWKLFVKEMKRGNGEILKPVRPIDIHLDYAGVEEMRRTVRAVEDANAKSSFDLAELERKASKSRTNNTSRQLTESQIEIKNKSLQRKLEEYEKDGSISELRRKRSELPMVIHKDDLLAMVNANDVCVVVGATGSGKTTQLPQLILEELTRSGKGGTCNIVCTQPRRIAAISVAQRVAVERNESLQESVGYAVRFDSKLPKFGGSINYCTTGILLRQLQENKDIVLDGLSHIIVDEVHERDIQIDFLLVILKQLMAERKAAGLPAIKLILMSATIDTNLFCRYFGSGFKDERCPSISIPGRTFPVTTHHLNEIHALLSSSYDRRSASELYSKDTSTYISRELAPNLALTAPPTENNSEDEEAMDRATINWSAKGVVGADGELELTREKEDTITPVGLMSVMIAHLLKTTNEGSILVFLPGFQEIMALNRLLTSSKPLGLDIPGNPDYKLYMLHSAIPQMQQEVFEKIKPGQRKIILSTNIAETSITIPDVVYVVDSSKVRESQYDQAKRISSLISTWTSKSSAKQRAGRAGRVQNGHYYTMASEARHESLEVTAQPEILRTDLQELCLQIKSMGVPDIQTFLAQAVQPPASSSIENAIDHLQSLRALDEQENLTPLCRLLSTLPVKPSLGKMVLLAAIFKCLDPILILAAAATGKDPFLSPPDRRQEADRTKNKWADGSGSDHVAVLNAFKAWRALRSNNGNDDRAFAFENFLHYNTLVSMAQTADQIIELMQKAGIVKPDAQRRSRYRAMYGSDEENVHSESRPLQMALLTAGFFPNIAVQTFMSRALRTAHENAAQIHINSLAAPRTSGSGRYGPIAREDQIPAGTLFTFSQKTQADQTNVMLRSVSKTSPLAVIFFGGSSAREGSTLKVDDWIPFYVRPQQMKAIVDMNALLNSYLETTFARLGASNQRKLLAQAGSQDGFLEQDAAREPLVNGIVSALEATEAKPIRSFNDRHDRRPHTIQRNNAALTSKFNALFTKSTAARDERRLI